MNIRDWVGLGIIIVTLGGVAVGRMPRLRMNRATIAIAGAAALIAVGATSLADAYAALDMDTLFLLFGIMVLNVNLRLAGFFRVVTWRMSAWARSPRLLLALIIGVAGILSAFFLNDTLVLMMTPLVVELTSALKRNPIPYLIGLGAAANIGSTATITGNPQNMIIGIASGIPYATFAARLAPIAVGGLVIAWGIIVLLYRREFGEKAFSAPPERLPHVYRPLLYKTMAVSALMAIALFAGAPIPLAAIAAAAVLFVTRRVDPQRVFRQIDWGLLAFFSGLFIVTHSLVTTGWSDRLFAVVQPVARSGVAALSIVSAALSNLVSNVPAVLLFRPLVPAFPDPTRAWLTLAMATTLAGNLTLLGSVANLIVAESAREHGVRLWFAEYLRAGVPITLLTLALGIVWLTWVV